MRDARNGKDITRQIARKTGIRVDIIDGQEEAHIVYDNHIEQLFASGQNYLYVDVGGGSTEINLISNGELKNSRSYNIGTVRMLSGMVKEEEKEALRTDLIGLPRNTRLSASSVREETSINFFVWQTRKTKRLPSYPSNHYVKFTKHCKLFLPSNVSNSIS